MILSLFRKDPSREAALALFDAAAAQARSPGFHLSWGIEDSVEGRFDLLALHVFLVVRRLRRIAGARRLAQHLIDTLFSHIDHGLREMGVGDLSVSRKARAYAEAFYGRIGAYDAALETAAAPAALEEALARNVFGVQEAAGAAPLANYVREAAALLDRQPDGRLTAGLAPFPPAPAAGVQTAS